MLKWNGRVRVTTHTDGGFYVDEFTNQITSTGLDMVRDLLSGDVTDGQIKYMAWGNSTTAATSTQSALGSEQGRKAVTTRTAGSTGVLTTTVYLSPQDANEQIQELGWFAGPNATSTAGAGIMVARVLYSKLKTNLESIQVDREDTIGVST